LAACIAARAGLETLSRERVRGEVFKLMLARHVVPTLAVMTETGLLGPVLGGVPLLASFANMVKLEATLSFCPNAVRRLGALAVSVIEDAERLRERLRLANAEHERLAVMADGWWEVAPAAGEHAGQALLYRIGRKSFIDRVLVAWSRSSAGVTDHGWRELARLPLRWQVPVFPLKAADLLERGVQRGPALGEALRIAEEAWIAAGFPDDAEALAAIAADAVRRIQ
jgi:poly(A) polymerase